MTSTQIAMMSAACIFSGALLGIGLRKIVPAEHLSPDARDAIKLGAGMISLLAALVLGLLVSSAKTNFDTTSAAITQGAAKVVLLDRVLRHYGPESEEIRDELRRGVATVAGMLWSDGGGTDADLEAFENTDLVEGLLEKVRHLTPRTEAQRVLHLQAQQLANDMLLSRWLQIEQAQVPLPRAFLAILLFWLTVLYVSFGLIAPRNATVLAAMLVGALSLGTAIFLILEMNHPMGGTMRVSGAPMRNALEHLRR